MGFTFKGISSSQYFVVEKIIRSILPPVSTSLVKVPGKPGAHPQKSELGVGKISCVIRLRSENITDLNVLKRDVAAWLYSAEEEELILEKEPDKYYMAKLDGETDLDEIVRVGKGQINFICPDPLAYGDEHTFVFTPTEGESEPVEVLGTYETSPKYELTLKENISSISVIGNEGYVMLGEPLAVEERLVNLTPTVFWDEMTNTTLWTSGSNIDGGVIAGTFGTNGYSFRVDNNDFGEDTTMWHGPTAIRSIPNPIENFEVRALFGMIESQYKEVGRIEVYLLDENNEQFGKMAMKETWASATSRWFEARAGKLSGGKYFINENRRHDTWGGNMKGLMRIGRSGNKWWAWIGKWMPELGAYRSRWQAEWYDTKGIATNNLAKIQIHIGGYKTFTPVQTMYIEDIKVIEKLSIIDKDEVPVIAVTDDVLLIDTEKGEVYRNGIPFFERLNPSSDFFTLSPGTNGITISPSVADVRLSYRERWL
jgi:predicted phage tail component-like protein